MTMQAPEVLESEAGAPDFPNLKLVGIQIGDIDDPRSSKNYPFAHKGQPSKTTMCTALWRGYVSAYRLRADGRLTLVRFEYPFTPEIAPDDVEEVLVGDFWLDLRESLLGDGIRVPFRDGRLVIDQTQWRPFPGIASRRTSSSTDLATVMIASTEGRPSPAALKALRESFVEARKLPLNVLAERVASHEGLLVGTSGWFRLAAVQPQLQVVGVNLRKAPHEEGQ
jgi:hypothetical protein